MLFTSFAFLFLFLPIVYCIFLIASHYRYLKFISLWLVLASIAFYAFWNPKDLLPLLISICVNYCFYRLMQHYMTSEKTNNLTFSKIKYLKSLQYCVLIVAISANLIFLGYYKYFDFFITQLASIPFLKDLTLFKAFIKTVDIETLKNHTHLYIPLGISFYTFTQIAFLIDCHRNTYQKNDFINYFLFVSYFPHLVCGPILSFKDLYPQLINSNKFRATFQNSCLFIFCFSIGLFKKTVIGDYLGMFADQFFSSEVGALFDFTTTVLGIICYALQLYFDFSGYSDMAVGVSHLFGLKIPDNFNAPYQATSIIDFWRRWHISLSNFLKNYVYIPLGGNRVSTLMLYRNLAITMLLGGLWHGAAWTFIVWGAYQGLLLSVNHWIRQFNFSILKTSDLSFFPNFLELSTFNKQMTFFLNFAKMIVTFILISLGWVLFRSQSLEQAMNIYKSLFLSFSFIEMAEIPTNLLHLTFQYKIQWVILIFGLLFVFFMPDTLILREKFMRLFEERLGEEFEERSDNLDSNSIKSQGSNIVINKSVKSIAIISAILSLMAILCFSKVQYFLYSGF